jgi:hypothetical protein
MKTTLVAATLLLVASTARAQDMPKVGLTMGYPSSVGLLWQIGDGFAVRPEISLSHVSGDSSPGDLVGIPTTLSSDATNLVSTGVSALFYVSHVDALKTYLTPRFSYARTSTSVTTNNSIAGPTTSDSTVSAYSASGAFGAQYGLGRHFGLFGEIGVGYTRTTTTVNSALTTTLTSIVNGVPTQTVRTQPVSSGSHANAVSTRSGVGVLFFF